MLRICVTVFLIYMINAQSMTQPAVKRFFKFCTAANLATVTSQLNGAKNVTLCNNVCSTFTASKNFINAGTTAPASDPVSKPAGAKDACQKFCAHRVAVKKYVDFQFKVLGTKYFTANKAAELKSLFWKVDKTDNNNFTKVSDDYLPQALTHVPDSKKNTLIDQVKANAGEFGKKFPADANNVFGYKY